MASHGTNSKGYKLQGKTEVQGIRVAIENRRGSVREGKNEDGTKWRTKFKLPYGYIEGTKGADDEEVDAYVGPDKDAPNAFVVEQKKDDGSYDEDTVMLGFKRKGDAVKAIKKHYDDPKYIGKTDTVPMDELKKKLKVAAARGEYKGRKMSAHSVKKVVQFQGLRVNIDRPKGFIMKGKDEKGQEWTRKYKYDYGYIPKTVGGDGDGLDIFIGPDKKADEAFWALQKKPDGSFDEYKVFLGFPDRDAAKSAYRQHIPQKLMSGMVTMKVSMMKAMLGINPKVNMRKLAAFVGMSDELEKLARGQAKEKVEHLAQEAGELLGEVPPTPTGRVVRFLAEAAKDKL